MRSKRQQLQHRRAAFTLIELMVAISIIALLIGLLVPALGRVRQNARIAQVKSEIGVLEGALAQFQSKFGEYPPSRITLYQDAAGWNGTGAEARRSKAIIRKYWPQFDFATNGGLTLPGASVTLDGAECLVFFLGGRRDGDDIYIGFSTNPAQPFSDAPANSRVGPFIEFQADRYTDTDGDDFFEYRDPLPGQVTPYIYLSAYDGRGYDTTDLDSRMTNFYREGSAATSKGWKQKTFQIISPGFDGLYGVGGEFDPDTADTLLVNNGTTDREPERDNITNFHGGTLAD